MQNYSVNIIILAAYAVQQSSTFYAHNPQQDQVTPCTGEFTARKFLLILVKGYVGYIWKESLCHSTMGFILHHLVKVLP